MAESDPAYVPTLDAELEDARFSHEVVGEASATREGRTVAYSVLRLTRSAGG